MNRDFNGQYDPRYNQQGQYDPRYNQQYQQGQYDPYRQQGQYDPRYNQQYQQGQYDPRYNQQYQQGQYDPRYNQQYQQAQYRQQQEAYRRQQYQQAQYRQQQEAYRQQQAQRRNNYASQNDNYDADDYDEPTGLFGKIGNAISRRKQDTMDKKRVIRCNHVEYDQVAFDQSAFIKILN